MAKIFSGSPGACSATTCSSSIAIEYASSPVAVATIHARSGSPGLAARACTSGTSALCRSTSKASASRKKRVTGISSSRRSVSTSSVWVDRWSAYPCSEPSPVATMRRSTRRSTVAGLYWLKSMRITPASRRSTPSRLGSPVAPCTLAERAARGSPLAMMLATSTASPSGESAWSAAPLPITARGMPSKRAVAGSWASTQAPAASSASAPRVPSEPVPESTMPMAREAASAARLSKKASMGSVTPVVGRGTRRSRPCDTVIVVPGGIT